MKKMALTLIAICMAALPVSAQAQDWCKTDFVRSWSGERDAAVARLIGKWLNGAPYQELTQDILHMTRKEIHMGNCSVQDLYISRIENTAAEQIPPAVFLIHLQRNGLDIHPALCFQGKTFTIRNGGR